MRHVAANRRRGMALLVVVVLTMLIALGAYRFSFYMESQYRLTRLHEEQVQARLAAMSGLELAASIVELPAADRASLGGLVDNPALLRHIAVDAVADAASRSEDANDAWRCGLLSPRVVSASDDSVTAGLNDGESLNVRFGFENESAKLPMQALLEWDRRIPGHARATLLGLPGATEPLVDAWLRGLGAIPQRTGGGASSLMERLDAASDSKDQAAQGDPLRWLWFGGDLNQNYRLDPLEVQLANQLTGDKGAGAGQAASGRVADSTSQPVAWQRYVTWHSGQRNETRLGQLRIFLNEGNLQALHQKLTAAWPADWANFVIAMRQYGPSGVSVAKAGEGAPVGAESSVPDFSKPSSYTFKSVLDLVGAVVQIPVTAPPSSLEGKSDSSSMKKQTLRNPFSSDLSEVRNYLGRILDEATTDVAPFTTGRIDVSECPVQVLAGVPGIDIALAQRIVQQRGANSGSNSGAASPEPRDTIAWLLDGGLIGLAKLKEIEPYLTCRNDVYTVQSVGYRDSLSPVFRCTVTIDARQIPAQIRNQQIWHPWDRGFSMDQLNSPTP